MESGYYKLVEKIVDYKTRDVEHKDANGNILYVEHITEPIFEAEQVWVDYTPEELIRNEYHERKKQLSDMDYKTSKYVDGEYTDEEWSEIVAERKSIRARIRELEQLL